METREPKDRLLAVGIEPKTVENIIKNKKVTESFMEVLDLGKLTTAPKEKGALLYAVATKLKPVHLSYKADIVSMVVSDKWTRMMQLDAGLEWLQDMVRQHGTEYKVDHDAFAINTGVGVTVTEEQIEAAAAGLFEKHTEEIKAKGHDFQFNTLIFAMRDLYKWADGGIVRKVIDAKKLALLGEEPKEDGTRKKKGKMTTEDKKKAKEAEAVDEEPTYDIKQLIGRDVNADNSEELLKKHREFTGGRVMTRFPPEPNGYLHIGHAKAIRFNFQVAKEYGGETYLRFDDTNPCKENQEFIDHIKEIVSWLGQTPWKVTHASDNFEQLYQFALQLIRQGQAYVCFQNIEDMRRCREEMVDSPWRDATVDENLERFEKMRTGRYAQGECCLRVKIDMKSVNPNMRDFVAYRIRFVSHPHAGDKWCIYPTYDFTHCLCDSLENITHSLCTLEFENRRESYYWLLKALNIYKPYVWEYSRLNVSNTVLSKRKIEQLVNEKHVRGWDDPRLHTVQGLRNRGYTPSMINAFCEAIGVSRKGNENMTSYKKIEFYARKECDENASRCFAVLDPLLLEIVNFDDVKEREIKAPLFPANPEKGNLTYKLDRFVYIDKEDFSATDKKGFFGVMPGQIVCLRYGPFVVMEGVETKDGATVVKVRQVPQPTDKVKGVIQWVAQAHSVSAVVNLYNPLMTVEDVNTDAKKNNVDWLTYFNKDSLIVKPNAMVWNHHLEAKKEARFQFERVGYFYLISDPKSGKLEFNRIVDLRESTAKKEAGK